jgi:MFS transporter, MHS family, shikimate and dehydroshikimate transport protein
MQHTPMSRVAAASAIGTILEWYDFALYNAMSGLVFNKIFFPSFDPLVGTLLSFLTYGVGMVARPIGGIICGRLGDIIGRRPMLIATVSTMGACVCHAWPAEGASICGSKQATDTPAHRFCS